MSNNTKLEPTHFDSPKDPIPLELRDSSRPGWISWGLGAAALILFLCTVFGDLSADSLFGPFAVEGQWLLEARRSATGEDIPLGDWRPGLLAPGLTWVSNGAFQMFGVSLDTARAASGAVSLITLFLFFHLAARASGTRAALWATLLLLCNPVYHAISRMASPSVYSLFWMTATVWFWRFGRRNPALAFLTGFLAVWTALGDNGPDALFFLASACVVMLFLRLHAIKMPWRPATLTRLRAILWGGAVMLALLLVVVTSHWEAYGRMWDHFTSFNWRVMVTNAVMAPVTLSSGVTHMPVTAILAVVYFLFFAKLTVRPVARHRQTNEVRLWFLAWLLAGGVYMVFSSARLEAQALLVPPLCLLAGEALVRLGDLQKIARPRIDVMIVTLMIFGIVWFGVAWMVRETYHLLPEGFWHRHQIRGTALLVGVLWPLIAFALTWAYLKWRRFTVSVGPRQVLVFTWLVLAGAAGGGAYEIATWYAERTHQVQAASRHLDTWVGEDDLLVGTWAPILTLDLPARAAMVWSAINDRPMPWQDRISHYLLVEGRETRPKGPPLSATRHVVQAPLDTLTVSGLRLQLRPVAGH